MGFFPSEFEQATKSNNYMKIQKGENKFRILSEPIGGWVEFIDNKPKRYKIDEKPIKSHDPEKPLKFFSAFIVFDYLTEDVKILEITQAGVRKDIQALSQDSDWGSPFSYDIKVTRTGEQLKTKYSVVPGAKSNISDYIKQCFNSKPINLEALFDGKDPFSADNPYFTAMGVCKEVVSKPDVITSDQANELALVLSECDPSYKMNTMSTLKKNFGVLDIASVPVKIYDRVYSAALKNRGEYKATLSPDLDIFGDDDDGE